MNFGANKISIYGEASIEEIEEAGSFENLKVKEESLSARQELKTQKQELSFGQKYGRLTISALLILLGFLFSFKSGDDSLIAAGLFAASILISGFNLFRQGLKNLSQAYFDMRTLMTIAVIGAMLIGEWAEGAIVVILFALSEKLESYAMDQSRQSLEALMELTPSQALVKRDGQEILLDIEDIIPGELIIIKPGERIAMDGEVTFGHSTVNQAPITGESMPVEKKVGDEVYAGSLNEEGLLEVEVSQLAENTSLAQIIHLVEEAQGQKAPAQQFVEKFAKYYTPFIMLVALLVALLPPLFFNQDWQTWIYQGLSILVVGCPCALVISTPIAVVTAIGNAARNGVLIKGGVYLEELGQVKVAAFDKTGTLTRGKPAVTDIIVTSQQDEAELLSLAAALEDYSQHPLASAVLEKAEENQVVYKNIKVTDFKSITGRGIQGSITGDTYYLGNKTFILDQRISLSTEHEQTVRHLQEQGKTVMILSDSKKVLGFLAVADQIREKSREVIAQLQEMGIEETVMLTGDNEATAQAVSQSIGVKYFHADLMPQDKLKVINKLEEDYGKVAMVGDGVNDAPALASASVGIAMGTGGTDTAIETADIALMADDLTKLPYAVRLSRKALRIIKWNITFSLGIKFLALLLVIPGWLTLWIAIMSDMGATLIVALNSLRLLKVKE